MDTKSELTVSDAISDAISHLRSLVANAHCTRVQYDALCRALNEFENTWCRTDESHRGRTRINTRPTTLTDALEIAKTSGMEAADSALDGCGIEYVDFKGRELAYVNMGDTYAETICREGEDSFFIGSWGDWLEGVEEEYGEDTYTIRCGYCGEFTPMDGKVWRDVVCEFCGNRLG